MERVDHEIHGQIKGQICKLESVSWIEDVWELRFGRVSKD